MHELRLECKEETAKLVEDASCRSVEEGGVDMSFTERACMLGAVHSLRVESFLKRWGVTEIQYESIEANWELVYRACFEEDGELKKKLVSTGVKGVIRGKDQYMPWSEFWDVIDARAGLDIDIWCLILKDIDREVQILTEEKKRLRRRVEVSPRLVATVALEARAKFGFLAANDANRKVVGHHMRKLLKKSECRMELVDRHVQPAMQVFFTPVSYDNVFKHSADTRIVAHNTERFAEGKLSRLRKWILGSRLHEDVMSHNQ
jgi:hypothetical protein